MAGTLNGCAYLPPKSTYESAELALRADLVRGLVARVSLLCEANEDADGGADDSWAGLETTSLPARAETAWVGPITVSDYRFPDDEEGADGAARLKELLGIDGATFDNTEAFGGSGGGGGSSSGGKGKSGGSGGGGGSSSSSSVKSATPASVSTTPAAGAGAANGAPGTNSTTTTTAQDPTMLYAAGAAVLAVAAGVVLMFGTTDD